MFIASIFRKAFSMLKFIGNLLMMPLKRRKFFDLPFKMNFLRLSGEDLRLDMKICDGWNLIRISQTLIQRISSWLIKN